MSSAEIQLTNGLVKSGQVQVKASGWVKLSYRENGVDNAMHFPPAMVEKVVGEVSYQSPHGRI